MPVANQTSTRFRDEIRSISPWAYALAIAVFLFATVALTIVIGKDHNAPPPPVRFLLGLLCGVCLGGYILLVGYINQDAGRRGMSRLLWTVVAIVVPNGLGIVLYFVLRKPRSACCPQCNAVLEPGFSFCPRCRYHLQPICSSCRRSVNLGDQYCPYCGGALGASAQASAVPSEKS